jgi:histone-lysine N-methyltransferase SETMAR
MKIGENHSVLNLLSVSVLMFIMFFDSRGTVRKNVYLQDKTVNHAFYKDVLERLRKRVQRVRKDIAGDWVQHHDIAPAHAALSIREFLAKKNIPSFPPPYSPDLAPCDFYLFPKLKSNLKGYHFGTVENLRKIVTDELRTLTEITSDTATINEKNAGTTV